MITVMEWGKLETPIRRRLAWNVVCHSCLANPLQPCTLDNPMRVRCSWHVPTLKPGNLIFCPARWRLAQDTFTLIDLMIADELATPDAYDISGLTPDWFTVQLHQSWHHLNPHVPNGWRIEL